MRIFEILVVTLLVFLTVSNFLLVLITLLRPLRITVRQVPTHQAGSHGPQTDAYQVLYTHTDPVQWLRKPGTQPVTEQKGKVSADSDSRSTTPQEQVKK